MKIIKPSFIIMGPVDGSSILKHIEEVGRVCYRSEDKITDNTAEPFIRRIVKNGHTSILEQYDITVKIICDRGVSHELVRHRTASFAQESTRYVCATGAKYSEGMEVIEPLFWEKDSLQYKAWHEIMLITESAYKLLIESGASPQQARSVLPNSLKTEIVIKNDLHNWRHFFELRCASSAHPQMREIALPMLKSFYELVPVVFEDLMQKFKDDSLLTGLDH